MTTETSSPPILGVEELLRLAVPIISVDIRRVGPLDLTVVRFNAQKRPDVADLVRVHHREGVGAGDFRWVFALDGRRPAADMAILHAELRQPVKCSFSAWLNIREHRRALEHLARVPLLVLAPSNVWPSRLAHESVAFEVPMTELPDVLAVTALRDRPGRRA